MKITMLNTSILTNFGTYSYVPATLKDVCERLGSHVCDPDHSVIESAIGHQSTAEILTELTGIDIPVNRINYRQEVGDLAIIFKLNDRPPEGKILSREEIEEIGFSFGLLTRTA